MCCEYKSRDCEACVVDKSWDCETCCEHKSRDSEAVS